MRADFDLAIVGSGFGGSLMAMIARRLGLSVLLLERGKHPRFAIGESTSPLMNLLLEEIARRYDLPRLLPLTAYGPWQRAYPEVVCGLKRGFTYFHHEAGRPFGRASDRSDQLMVAASPCDEVADTHWLRSDVDRFLCCEAVDAGAEYMDEAALSGVEGLGSGPAALSGERHGRPFTVRARLVVDATGPRGFLSRALRLPESRFAGYPSTQTLFSHFAGVRRCDRMEAFATAGAPPYPADDAALHHVFDGGWMWVLRFNNGVTSAGVAVKDDLAEELRLSEGSAAWARLLERFPSIREQFEAAEPLRPFVYWPTLSYRCSAASGEGWVMLPSAAAFVDPLFSTGMPLTLLGIERLGRILEEAWGRRAMPDRLAEHGAVTLAEADWTARFIGACFAAMGSFPHFAAFSLFYFASASFSEMARRLGRRDLARRFLAADRPDFARGLEACADLLICPERRAAVESAAFQRRVWEAIEPIDIAGLCDPARRNWHPVDLADLVRGAGKLGLTPEAMQEIIATAAWAQTTPVGAA